MESDAQGMDPTTAAAELEALQAKRAALAERVVQPWWYDLLGGVLVFVLFSSYATHNWWVIGAAAIVFFSGSWALMAVYKRMTGIWVSSHRPGPTKKAMTVWFWCCITWGAAAILDLVVGLPALVVGVSAACGVAVALVNRWWTRLYVAELRGEL